MEQLLPVITNSQKINVPYVATEEFEATDLPGVSPLENFKGYWLRRGWQGNRETGDLIFDNRTYDEIASFLQTAFYFGCIISVFRIVGITVRTVDFLEKHPNGQETFVRTTILQGYIGEWAKFEDSTSEAAHSALPGRTSASAADLEDKVRQLRKAGIKELLNFTFGFLQMFCRQSHQMPKDHKDRMHLIELSIMAVGESLCSALTEIYKDKAQTIPTWGPSPILEARLRDRDWCPSDSPFFPESKTRAAVSVNYYFGSSQCPRPHRNHPTCTAAICDAFLAKINPNKVSGKTCRK